MEQVMAALLELTMAWQLEQLLAALKVELKVGQKAVKMAMQLEQQLVGRKEGP